MSEQTRSAALKRTITHAKNGHGIRLSIFMHTDRHLQPPHSGIFLEM